MLSTEALPDPGQSLPSGPAIRLFADEDFNRKVVVELRALGYDVLTAREAGISGQGLPDPYVLALAISLGRAVLTFNRRHYFRLHRHVQPHHGIIACKRDNDVKGLAARIHQAIAACPNLENQLLRVNRPHKP